LYYHINIWVNITGYLPSRHVQIRYNANVHEFISAYDIVPTTQFKLNKKRKEFKVL